MANRIFYAVQQVAIDRNGDGAGYQAVKGVQSVSMTTPLAWSRLLNLVS